MVILIPPTGNKEPSSVSQDTTIVSNALLLLVISDSTAVSIAVINWFLNVSILDSAPLTNPDIIKSIVPCLVLAPFPSSESSLVSSDVWTITAGYCCSDSSSIGKGCLVAFLIVIGLLIPEIVDNKFDAISSLTLIFSYS